MAVSALQRTQERCETMPDRLEGLFDAHHERLHRLALRLSRDAEQARDLVQKTFLRAARRVSSVPEGRSGEEAWLVRVLVNLCRDQRVWRGRPEPSLIAPGTSPAAIERGKVVPSDLRPARTIHFVTPSGTRVIWTLDPNFALYPDDEPTRL